MVLNISQKLLYFALQEIWFRGFCACKESLSLFKVSFLLKPYFTQSESSVVVKWVVVKELVAVILRPLSPLFIV
jgi:hypothetical protein